MKAICGLSSTVALYAFGLTNSRPCSSFGANFALYMNCAVSMLTPEMLIASFLVISLSDAALLFFAWSRVKISVADTSRPKRCFFNSSILYSFSSLTSIGDTYFDFSR